MTKVLLPLVALGLWSEDNWITIRIPLDRNAASCWPMANVLLLYYSNTLVLRAGSSLGLYRVQSFGVGHSLAKVLVHVNRSSFEYILKWST